jgi:hypothetical protein
MPRFFHNTVVNSIQFYNFFWNVNWLKIHCIYNLLLGNEHLVGKMLPIGKFRGRHFVVIITFGVQSVQAEPTEANCPC